MMPAPNSTPIDHMANPWTVGAPKQIDFPIETIDAYGARVVVARVPKTSKVNADEIAKLVSATPDMASVLVGLVRNRNFITTDAPFAGVLEKLLNAAVDALEKAGVDSRV